MISKEAKLYLFKDRDDYIKQISLDDVVNVIGTKGSGKTTSSLKYINNSNYVVINCDRLFELPENDLKEDKEMAIIRAKLKEKYLKILDGEEFINCYNDIVSYIKDMDKKAFIEGNVIQDIVPITKLRGKVIVKRTGVVKSFIRSVKRDYGNEYFMKLEIAAHGRMGKFYRLKNIIVRRKKIFKNYHDIEKIIDTLVEFNGDFN